MLYWGWYLCWHIIWPWTDLSWIVLSHVGPLVFLLLISLSNILALSVPDDSYSRNASFPLI